MATDRNDSPFSEPHRPPDSGPHSRSDEARSGDRAESDSPIPRSHALAIGICASLCLLVPFGLWLTGRRSPMLENRAPTKTPELSWSAVSDGSYFSDLETKMVETFPLRTRVVEAQAMFRWKVLDDSPNPDKVLLGTDGWMYYRRAVQEPCHMGEFVEPTVAEMLRVSRMAYAMGADPLTVVPPVKQAIYPEHMTDTLREFAACAIDAQERLRAALLVAPFPRFVDAWGVLEEAKSVHGPTHILYWMRDTHWNSLGAAVTGAAIMNDYLPQADAAGGLSFVRSLPYRGDIAVLGGLQATEQTERWVLKRPKAVERTNGDTDYVVSDDAAKRRGLSVETRDAVVDGLPMLDDLVLLGDSFRLNIREMLAAFAHQFQVVQWDRYQPSWLIDRVEAGATLVLESVDRLSDRRYLDRDLGDHMTYAVVQRFAGDVDQPIDVDGGTAEFSIAPIADAGGFANGVVQIDGAVTETVDDEAPQTMLVVQVGGALVEPDDHVQVRINADGPGVPDPQALSAEPIAPEGWTLHRTSDGSPFAVVVIDSTTDQVTLETLAGNAIDVENAWVITTTDAG